MLAIILLPASSPLLPAQGRQDFRGDNDKAERKESKFRKEKVDKFDYNKSDKKGRKSNDFSDRKNDRDDAFSYRSSAIDFREKPGKMGRKSGNMGRFERRDRFENRDRDGYGDRHEGRDKYSERGRFDRRDREGYRHMRREDFDRIIPYRYAHNFRSHFNYIHVQINHRDGFCPICFARIASIGLTHYWADREIARMETRKLISVLDLNDYQADKIFKINLRYLRHKNQDWAYAVEKRDRDIMKVLSLRQCDIYMSYMQDLNNSDLCDNCVSHYHYR